jgi:hypothetical protein
MKVLNKGTPTQELVLLISNWLFILMQTRIQLFPLMQIRIGLHIKVMRICNLHDPIVSLHGSRVSLHGSIVSLH